MAFRTFSSICTTRTSRPCDPSNGRIEGPALFRALRGIWVLGGQEIALDVDQETGELMACTYEGEHLDPRPVITR